MNAIQQTNAEFLEGFNRQLRVRVLQDMGFHTTLNYGDSGALLNLLIQANYQDDALLKVLNDRVKNGTGVMLSMTNDQVNNMYEALHAINLSELSA